MFEGRQAHVYLKEGLMAVRLRPHPLRGPNKGDVPMAKQYLKKRYLKRPVKKHRDYKSAMFDTTKFTLEELKEMGATVNRLDINKIANQYIKDNEIRRY